MQHRKPRTLDDALRRVLVVLHGERKVRLARPALRESDRVGHIEVHAQLLHVVAVGKEKDAPVILAGLEDRRVQLELLDLREALDGPRELRKADARRTGERNFERLSKGHLAPHARHGLRHRPGCDLMKVTGVLLTSPVRASSSASVVLSTCAHGPRGGQAPLRSARSPTRARRTWGMRDEAWGTRRAHSHLHLIPVGRGGGDSGSRLHDRWRWLGSSTNSSSCSVGHSSSAEKLRRTAWQTAVSEAEECFCPAHTLMVRGYIRPFENLCVVQEQTTQLSSIHEPAVVALASLVAAASAQALRFRELQTAPLATV